jgi:hypothetical protein
MKRKKRTPEERAADEARFQDQKRRVQERIDYWRAKSDERRERS